MIEAHIALLKAAGWHITPYSPDLQAATGLVAGGWREGLLEPVWRCPECGHAPEPVPFEVAGEHRWGWACPQCGAMGWEEHLPKERRVVSRAWTAQELAQEAERYRPRPVPRGLEEEMRRREVWVRDRLEELVDEVRRAPAGNRNNTLAAAAYKAGRLLARYPAASSQEVVDRLVEAAVEAGLPRVEARATAERGVRKGLGGGG